MKRRFWTSREDATLRLLYAENANAALAKILRRTPVSIYYRARLLGLRKSPQYIREVLEALCERLQLSGRETQFRKGHRSHTWKPVGSHRVNAEGYLDRKVADTGYPPRDWVGVHRLVWIEHHGPIPPGFIVRFKPGFRTARLEEITVDRLELISRQENMRRNTVHRLPNALKRAVQLRGALIREINRRSR
jgi:hypothetical protein